MAEKEIELYTTEDGKCPFIEWIHDLSSDYRIRINKRINRMKEGNYGDWKKLQNSQLSELRFNFGKGYRVYFKELDNVIILLLAGSDKSDQKTVIKQADKYLDDYLQRSNKR
ncbi:type II toxin-antitoxin system RelE/ParE family toxin [bacterium]|nr:type II toxin-antitoxin system RelE/ParE family toxin [bacterium]